MYRPRIRKVKDVKFLIQIFRKLGTKLFLRLTDIELQTVAMQTRSISIRKGENLFEVGDPGDVFYIIFSGQVGVFLPTHNSNETPSWKMFEQAVKLAKSTSGRSFLRSSSPSRRSTRKSNTHKQRAIIQQSTKQAPTTTRPESVWSDQ